MEHIQITEKPKEAMQAFLENSKQVLERIRVPTIMYNSEEIKVELTLMGFDIIMSEELTQEIVKNGTTVEDKGENTEDKSGKIEELIGAMATLPKKIEEIAKVGAAAGFVLPQPVGVTVSSFCTVFAKVINFKYELIKKMDNGNGVYWPLYWPLLIYIVTPPDPIGMYGRALLVLIPLPNK